MAEVLQEELALESTCFYCDREATRLCDGQLAWRKRAESDADWEVIDTDRDDALVTCDRPLCMKHAQSEGVVHYCGPKGCDCDTVDYCRDCHRGLSEPSLVNDREAEALQRRQKMHLA